MMKKCGAFLEACVCCADAGGWKIPQLLLVPTEEEFDRIWTDYITQRKEMGFAVVKEEAERQFQRAKEKLGLE